MDLDLFRQILHGLEGSNTKIELRLDATGKEFKKNDDRLGAVELHLDSMDSRLSVVEAGLDSVHLSLAAMEENTVRLSADMENGVKPQIKILFENQVAILEYSQTLNSCEQRLVNMENDMAAIKCAVKALS